MSLYSISKDVVVPAKTLSPSIRGFSNNGGVVIDQDDQKTKVDQAIEALVKFIPVEVVAPYLAVVQAIKQQQLNGVSLEFVYWFFAALSVFFLVIFSVSRGLKNASIPPVPILVWKSIAAVIAFCCWALIVADGAYSERVGLAVATILALLISPLLVAVDVIAVHFLSKKEPQAPNAALVRNLSRYGFEFDDAMVRNFTQSSSVELASAAQTTSPSKSGVFPAYHFDVPAGATLLTWVEPILNSDGAAPLYSAELDIKVFEGDKLVDERLVGVDANNPHRHVLGNDPRYFHEVDFGFGRTDGTGLKIVSKVVDDAGEIIGEVEERKVLSSTYSGGRVMTDIFMKAEA